MSLLELPRRRDAPRIFIEPDPYLARRMRRALGALDGLSDDFPDAPGLPDLAHWLIGALDQIEAGTADLEPEEDCDGEEESLPLLAFAGLTP